MMRIRTLTSALVLGLCVTGYTGALLADEAAESKFADRDRLYESFMADDEAMLAEDLAAINESYTPDNIDEVLAGFDGERSALEGELSEAKTLEEGLLEEASTTKSDLEKTLAEEIPDEISDATDAADAGLALGEINGLLGIEDDALLAEEIVARGLDPAVVTRETLAGWGSTLDEQIGLWTDADAAAKDQQEIVDGLSDQIDGLNDQIAQITEVTSAFNEKAEDIAAAIDNLSAEEVFALNRSLNNASNNGLLALMQEDGLDILEMAQGMTKQQINALTKAYEEEAKFTKLADKFAEESKQREHMLSKAAAHKERFLGKAGVDIGDAVAETAKSVAKDAAKGAARDAAKDAAKDSAKLAAKGAAKDAAKLAAKDAAKSAAKDAAKGAAKQAAKQAAKDAAKQAAKDAAKNAGKA